ncbi:MAG TPA: CPBP family intramembrane glutamic endopeptidase [Deinococcales bacterium]|nr:CPBP family intramembrane glutamic endopeptidase [Deinococcales bacterium]
MRSTIAARPRVPSRLPWIAAGIVLAALAVSFATEPVFVAVHGLWPLEGGGWPGVQFAALQAAVLLAGTWLWPRGLGWRTGRTWREWPATLGVALGSFAVVLAYSRLAGATPYAGADWTGFTVVPLMEEGLFRGLAFTAAARLAARELGEGPAARYALLVSTLAFALAHASNALYVAPLFTAFQVAYSAVFGLAFGWLRARTGSVWGPVAAHAAMNLAATFA